MSDHRENTSDPAIRFITWVDTRESSDFSEMSKHALLIGASMGGLGKTSLIANLSTSRVETTRDSSLAFCWTDNDYSARLKITTRDVLGFMKFWGFCSDLLVPMEEIRQRILSKNIVYETSPASKELEERISKASEDSSHRRGILRTISSYSKDLGNFFLLAYSESSGFNQRTLAALLLLIYDLIRSLITANKYQTSLLTHRSVLIPRRRDNHYRRKKAELLGAQLRAWLSSFGRVWDLSATTSLTGPVAYGI